MASINSDPSTSSSSFPGTTSSRHEKALQIDWAKCVVCQSDTDEKLVCPANSTRTSFGSGYTTFADNLLKFQEIGELPVSIDVRLLDEGHGVEETLKLKKAVWHKSCSIKFGNMKLERAIKRKSTESTDATVSPAKTRTKVDLHVSSDSCFFCEKNDGTLHKARTKGIDEKVKWCAKEIDDSRLLAKLAGSDMHALDIVYHNACLVDLYNKARSHSRKCNTVSDEQCWAEGIALAELASYVEEQADDMVFSFKLSDLVKLYETRLTQLGACKSEKVNSTRLKERLLSQVSGLQAYKSGRDVLLAFEENIGDILKLVRESNHDQKSKTLADAAKILRNEMMDCKQDFHGSFGSDCHKKCVPESLRAMMSMILEGPNIVQQSQAASVVSSALSELLMFNIVKKQRSCNVLSLRHNIDRETPLAIYLALVVHAETRRRDLIDKIHQLGLCISYDRVLQISADLGNRAIQYYEQERLVCPMKLKKNLFTTGQVDNIDHNPTSRDASGSFHGTAITLTQHPASGQMGSECQLPEEYIRARDRHVRDLPQSYNDITPQILPSKDIIVPKVHGPVKLEVDEKNFQNYGKSWLEHAHTLIPKETLDDEDNASWSAYQASIQQKIPRPVSLTALLPLFSENSHSATMLVHAIKLIKADTEYLNIGQCPVMTVDQPLYAISKQIQWNLEGYKEDSMVIMMGGLHIEMAVQRMIGHWLENSGWAGAVDEAGVATSGKVEAILKGGHVTRSRYAHQVSAVALYVLQRQAYEDENLKDQNVMLDFDRWREEKEKQYPQFLYWATVLKLELLLLEYVKSIREGNFQLYLEVLAQIIPWLFALDCNNYARWLPVHLRDMLNLSETHPDVYQQFSAGNFVVKKSEHAFSMIALDQCHEQENAKIKGLGGAVGLTEDPAALRRWLIAGPEVARVVTEFEESLGQAKSVSTKHHDQSPTIQQAFVKNVRSLSATIEQMGNPFMDNSADLIRIDTKEIMPKHVIDAIKSAHQLGIAQYEAFVKERLDTCQIPLTNTIPRNKLPLFGTYVQTSLPNKTKVSALKSDCNLFARLYLACQTRDGNIEEFFKHENSAYPPSLSNGGELRHGKKSDLLQCLKVTNQNQQLPVVDMKVFDGAAIVNMLPPRNSKTFKEYSELVFLPYLIRQAKDVKRVDVVWDRYLENSLKESTRATRGLGIHRKVLPNTTIPRNWQTFLRCSENKVELFEFLSKEIVALTVKDVIVISSLNDTTISNCPIDLRDISSVNHEEADTRMLLHVGHGAAQGYNDILIRTVDTDVVALAVANVHELNINLWLAFGVGKSLTFISANSLANSLGPDKSKALLFFHAFSGSDTTSSFAGKGKKTAFEAWNVMPEVTETFKRLSSKPTSITPEDEAMLERFTVVMYSRTCSLSQVDKARQMLFAQGRQSLENIPPTKAALQQHIKRAAFQSGHIWGQTLKSQQDIPDATEWGWERCQGRLTPKWTTLPEASKVCQELINCKCKKACRGLCKCSKASLSCTSLCYCGGACHQVDEG